MSLLAFEYGRRLEEAKLPFEARQALLSACLGGLLEDDESIADACGTAAGIVGRDRKPKPLTQLDLGG